MAGDEATDNDTCKHWWLAPTDRDTSITYVRTCFFKGVNYLNCTPTVPPKPKWSAMHSSWLGVPKQGLCKGPCSQTSLSCTHHFHKLVICMPWTAHNTACYHTTHHLSLDIGTVSRICQQTVSFSKLQFKHRYIHIWAQPFTQYYVSW